MQGSILNASSPGSHSRRNHGKATLIVAYLSGSRRPPASAPATGSSVDQSAAVAPPAAAAVVAPPSSSIPGGRRRRVPPGPLSGARARVRGGILNPDHVRKSAAQLVDFLQEHNTSEYAFKEVALVLRERERRRRLGEAESRLLEAEGAADRLRVQVKEAEARAREAETIVADRLRDELKESKKVADRLRGEVTTRVQELEALVYYALDKMQQTEQVGSSLRDKARALDLRLRAAEERVRQAVLSRDEARAREHILEARALEAEELADRLRDELKGRDLILRAADDKAAEATRRAADAEARLQDCQRRMKRLCDVIVNWANQAAGLDMACLDTSREARDVLLAIEGTNAGSSLVPATRADRPVELMGGHRETANKPIDVIDISSSSEDEAAPPIIVPTTSKRRKLGDCCEREPKKDGGMKKNSGKCGE